MREFYPHRERNKTVRTISPLILVLTGSVLNINQDLTLSNQARLDFRSGNVYIGENINDNNTTSSGIIFGATNSNYNFDGLANQSLNSAHTLRFYNINIQQPAGVSLIMNTDIQVNNTLNLNDDYLTLKRKCLVFGAIEPVCNYRKRRNCMRIAKFFW